MTTHTPTKRLHGLDALRGSALLLGIFFHATLSFTPGETFWFILDTQRSTFAYATGFWVHMFRMSLFFLLAGYFARMLIHRLGTHGFIRDRLKRITAPLFIFWLPLMIAFAAVGIWAGIVMNGGVVPDAPPPPPLTLETFPLTHLWFLYLLVICYAGASALRALLSAVRLANTVGALCDNCIRALSGYGILPVLLGAIIGLTLLSQSDWLPAVGVRTPDTGFVPNTAALISYFLAFGFGYLLQREESLLTRVTRHWHAYLMIAAAITAYCLYQMDLSSPYSQTMDSDAKTPFALLYGMGIWFWTLGIIGASLKFWSKESTLRRYIADSSYWLYIIHLPIVIALQVAVSPLTIFPELKLLLIMGISIPLMLLSYEWLVRYRALGSLLNGRKHIRTSAAAPLTETAK